ncbi:hypothetical protein AAVH_37928, partial [Aphelenchoides avenae]
SVTHGVVALTISSLAWRFERNNARIRSVGSQRGAINNSHLSLLSEEFRQRMKSHFALLKALVAV